jgi:hypothetical protein
MREWKSADRFQTLVPCGFCRIFHNPEKITGSLSSQPITFIIGKTRVWRGLRTRLPPALAPIPVTGLWTGCTRLKTGELQVAIFD